MIIQQSILLVKTSGGNFRRSLLFGILRYENFYDFFCFSYKRKIYFSFKTTKIISMYCQKRKSVIEYEITVYERVGVTMNKSELVAIMAEKASLSKKDAEGALNAFVDAVKDSVKKNDKVQLVGFGIFESRKREAREGKNPQTGEKIKIAACNSPAFKPGKGFKDYIN